jgi:type II secretory pathway pseudopilin PulG
MTTRRRPSGDDGTTLMELMVGMSVMAIFMAIFTAAIVNVFSTTNKTQAVVNSSTQLNLAFEQLDTQVRYASLIDPVAAAPWSVAFQTDGTASTTCRTLTISPTAPSDVRNNIVLNNLVERTWTMNADADGLLSTPGPVTQSVLANGVALVDQNGTAVTPFTVSTPAVGTLLQAQEQVHQQLDLRLVAVDGNGKSLTKSFSEITFTALNSATPSYARSSGTALSLCEQTEPPL